MPRRDGTGPMGAGSMTGRGMGVCTDSNRFAYGTGFGRRLGFSCRGGFGRGFGRSFILNQVPAETQKERLQLQKEILENQLEAIDKQLEDL